ncbi:MAG: hypothetical protein A3J48_02800 [Candidatus Doudnabacteria bacterium RIFCSPHIGHO2_02_FULL_46_11]|uniref:Tagatose-bisphosphate aldolase n=1 Tax=Candidatus Doudnabacteria bacterium RIFCSPHIGHO2_02_FULL_46_11 TaxID=1817832 RepID=A0A1F5P5C3_9BACT|nr:MAG: hypothetical protein A3J48_02800 [Candidatus Doudnabacteria bacterium RIFCSPHIGHO2_02_FULL_46_11]
MLVHYKDLFKNNLSGRFAIPAFNSHNLEITLGIIRAAVAKNAPVIVEAAANTVKYAGLNNIYSIVASVARDPSVTVPVALHLDHDKDPEEIARAVDAGFSSVMIDASHLPFEENIVVTRKVVEYAHSKGVWVQAELGRLRGNEDWVSVSEAEALYTDPAEAEEFVRRTKVDTLAIAVGTLHGIIKFRENIKPKIDIERIKKIKERLDIPLILHGASGIPADQIDAAIAAGICVINIDTELRMAFSQAVREAVKDENEIDPRKILKPAVDAVQKVCEFKLEEFHTAGKANEY